MRYRKTIMTLIGIIGGTGDLGTALAIHLAKKNDVLLGSRILEKARSTVETIRKEKNHTYLEQNLKPCENLEVVRGCEILLLTVPHENAFETVSKLSGDFRGNQVLISAVAAVAKRGEEFVVDEDPSGKSFAEKIKEIVPITVKVAAAFQTIPANIMYKEREISSDVLVSTDDIATFASVSTLVRNIDGLRPLYLGSLRLAGEIERLTALLLNIGKRNKLKSPTLKFESF
ncbi:MAG TPA: NAD(P)-binding domain-containing protein [Nitrososphaerales archaeon]|nr:NAD(P)-binding domain-containing protein [Nitrososphaerales archaeon]